jgi:hypothetical protein
MLLTLLLDPHWEVLDGLVNTLIFIVCAAVLGGLLYLGNSLRKHNKAQKKRRLAMPAAEARAYLMRRNRYWRLVVVVLIVLVIIASYQG